MTNPDFAGTPAKPQDNSSIEFTDFFKNKIRSLYDYWKANTDSIEEISKNIEYWKGIETTKPDFDEIIKYLAHKTQALCGGLQSEAQKNETRKKWLDKTLASTTENELKDQANDITFTAISTKHIAIILQGLSIKNPVHLPFITENEKIKELIDIFNMSITNETEQIVDEDWFSNGRRLYDNCSKIIIDNDSSFNGKDEVTQSYLVSRILVDLVYSSTYDITAEHPNHIFYGAPGTGKTFTVNKLITIRTSDEKQCEYVQCHPGYGYEDFIEGLKPVGFTSSGSIRFEVVNGAFKDLCIRAKNDPDNEYYFVADEINRANLSAMFGEALSLLEADYRYDSTEGTEAHKTSLRSTPLSMLIAEQIDELEKKAEDAETRAISLKAKQKAREAKAAELEANEAKTKAEAIKSKQFFCETKDGKTVVKFGIPKNIRFIGTMNDVDKSIDAFDIALRRRFLWHRMSCNYDVVLSSLDVDENYSRPYVYYCNTLNKLISSSENECFGLGDSYEFGHQYFMKIDTEKSMISRKNYESLFDTRLAPLLREYLREKFDESDIERKLKDAKSAFIPQNGNINPNDIKSSCNKGKVKYDDETLEEIRNHLSNVNKWISKNSLLGDAFIIDANIVPNLLLPDKEDEVKNTLLDALKVLAKKYGCSEEFLSIFDSSDNSLQIDSSDDVSKAITYFANYKHS